MTYEEKSKKCSDFFDALSEFLSDIYKVMPSCNNDISKYLVPAGTESEVTYVSKPKNSFRFSDHWNWYANTKKCPDPDYVQCNSADAPWPKERLKPGKASFPVQALQCCVMEDDGLYHVIFGERYNRDTGEWTWCESDPEEWANYKRRLMPRLK